MRRPPRATRSDTLVPYPTRFRSPIRERTLWIDIDQDHRPGAGQLSLHRQMPRKRGLAGPAPLRCHCENPHQRPLKILLFQRSAEHTSELKSLMRISYAVFFLKTNNTHSSYPVQRLPSTHTD